LFLQRFSIKRRWFMAGRAHLRSAPSQNGAFIAGAAQADVKTQVP
jgi:hypothetical protein